MGDEGENTWQEMTGENEKKEKRGDTWSLVVGRWTEEGPCYEVKWKIGCRREAAREVT